RGLLRRRRRRPHANGADRTVCRAWLAGAWGGGVAYRLNGAQDTGPSADVVGVGWERQAGPYAAWMPHPSLHGRIHGVSCLPLPPGAPATKHSPFASADLSRV